MGGRSKWDLLSTSLLSISLLIFIANLNYWREEVEYVYLFCNMYIDYNVLGEYVKRLKRH